MKHRKLRAYLSGGMEYARREGADWRAEMQRWLVDTLHHRVFNPNKESEKYLAKKYPHGNIRALKFQDIKKYARILKGVVALDSKEIAYRSDYVVCYWDDSAQKGAGTKGEVTIAKLFQKPVYLVTTMKHEQIPGWVLGCASRLFSSFDELKSFLLDTYNRKG